MNLGTLLACLRTGHVKFTVDTGDDYFDYRIRRKVYDGRRTFWFASQVIVHGNDEYLGRVDLRTGEVIPTTNSMFDGDEPVIQVLSAVLKCAITNTQGAPTNTPLPEGWTVQHHGQ